MRVFIDTSAWLAVEIANDYNHKKAIQHKALFKKQRAMLFTNEYVLAETYTRLIYDKYLQAASEFHQKISKGVKESSLVILEINHPDREEVWKELRRYSDHKLSFTDGTIVSNFRKYHLDQIFTFDHHFHDINLPTNLSDHFAA